MSGLFEHPSLKFLVTEEQRDRALAFLQDAFAKGRIDEVEFDDRMGQALAASTRKELNAAFNGLVHIPISTGSVSPVRRTSGLEAGSNIGAGLLHWSQFVGYIIPPVIALGVADKGSRTRNEAVQAILFSLSCSVGIAAAYLFLPGVLSWVGGGLLSIVWVLGVVIGGARAAKGMPTYPFLPGAFKPAAKKKSIDW